jgi:hypothetical protein
MSHCDCSLITPYLAGVDTSLLNCAEAALSCTFSGVQGALARKRLRLPFKCTGGGLLSLVESAPSFFAGAILRSTPSFIDRNIDGIFIRGLYNTTLGHIFGAGSFDDALNHNFTTFTSPSTACPLGLSFASAWASLRTVSTAGVLNKPVENANGVQHSISKIIHTSRFEALRSDVDAGVYSIRDRILFGQIDSFSSTFLRVLPCEVGACSPLEWAEISSQYFFLPSPAISSFVGQPIMDRKRRNGNAVICDEFGDNLQGITLPFDGYRRQHDASKNSIASLGILAGLDVQTELLNLFKSVVPPSSHNAFTSAHQDGLLRSGQGLIPDLKLRLPNDNGGSADALCEVKTLHMGSSTYRVRGEGLRSVDIRAAKIHPDLEKKLKAADIKYCGSSETGPPGPMILRLRSFGVTKGLVFGCVGEVSDDTKTLIHSISKAAGQEFARRQTSANRSITIGNGSWYAKRVLAMAGLRARANLLLDRLQFLGPGAQGAYERYRSSTRSFNTNHKSKFFNMADDMRRDEHNAHRHNGGQSEGRWRGRDL